MFNIMILAAAWQNGTLTEMADADEVIPVSKLAPRIEQYLNDIESSKQVQNNKTHTGLCD